MGDLATLEALRGQDAALRTFRSALAPPATGGAPRVAGAYLLHGPEGVGRRLGAVGFAAALLCSAPRDALPCGRCRACAWAAAGTHPDLLVVSGETGPFFRDDGDAARSGLDRFTAAFHAGAKRGARKSLPVRTLRRLLSILSLSAAGGARKVVIVDALDDVEGEGVATLLKSLEEPPPETTFLVLAGSVDGVPDTILSRCQRVRFRPLADDVVSGIVAAQAETRPDPQLLDLAVRLAQGSAGRALRAVEMGLGGVPDASVALLLGAGGPGSPTDAAEWVQAAGRDLGLQRERAHEVVALALLRCRERAETSGDASELDAIVPALAGALESLQSRVSPELVLRSLWSRVARARRLSS